YAPCATIGHWSSRILTGGRPVRVIVRVLGVVLIVLIMSSSVCRMTPSGSGAAHGLPVSLPAAHELVDRSGHLVARAGSQVFSYPPVARTHWPEPGEGKSSDADVQPYFAVVAAPRDDVVVAETVSEGVGRIVGLVIVELSDGDHDLAPLTVDSRVVVVGEIIGHGL